MRGVDAAIAEDVAGGEVGAGAETPPCTSEDDDTDLAVGRRLFQRLHGPFQELGGHAVQAFGPVEGDGSDAVAGFVEDCFVHGILRGGPAGRAWVRGQYRARQSGFKLAGGTLEQA